MAAAETPDAMDQIGWVFLTWKRLLQRGLSRHSINLKQVYLLRRLSECSYLFPASIAEELFCDRPTATVIVNTLERRGWVRRDPDPSSAKRKRVRLSRLGRAKLASIPEAAYRTGKTAIDPLGCLAEAERVELTKLLGKLTDHLQAAATASPDGRPG